MKTRLTVILPCLLVAVLLSAAVPANAAPITIPFYVAIDSITLSGDLYDPVAAAAAAPSTVRVGDRVFGSVTYDDSTIPSGGAYSVGIIDPRYFPPGYGSDRVNELQPWILDWPGLLPTGFGNWFSPAVPFPYLAFKDGRLSGIYAGYDLDWYYQRTESIVGTADRAYVKFPYAAEVPGVGFILFDANQEIRGTVYFSAPDPGSSLLLLGMSLAGLMAWRKRQ